MKSASNGKTKRRLQALGLAVAVITAGLIAFPSPAQAGNDHGKKKGHRKHVARHHAHRYTYDHVPYRFAAAHRRAYRQHYHGRVYDGRHRHYHEV
ncbi:MAG TPA: hypothetical protein VFG08_08935, partial [Candidatus Polarisedimenticolia bacterium]|nr:hypothetical protein [Candidatus Polarisedimenticolia bacterium]